MPTTVPLDDLAAIADRSFEIIKQNQTTPAITANINTSQSEIDLLKQTTKLLQESVTNLTNSINQLTIRQSRSPSRSNYRTRSSSRKPITCYYHYKFKTNARSCNFGCQYFDKNLFNPKTCVYHARFGDDARQCSQGCTWNSSQKIQKPKNTNSNKSLN